MFGYVQIYKPQLRVCEYEMYRAVYCTLCRELGKGYGPFARLLLNYDYTFVAMLYIAVRGIPAEYQRKCCACNPLKRCGHCACEDTEGFALTSAMTAVMFYHKASDNVADSGAFKSLLWRGVRLMAAPMRKRAKKRYPLVDELTAQCMTKQLEAESDTEASVDSVAEPSARMISELAQLIATNEVECRILKDFGYYFGRWIYLIDALDDIEKDIKKSAFNPFVRKFELTREDIEQDSEKLKAARVYANECLNMTVARALKAFSLLDTGEFAPIFENILTLGLGESQRKAMHGKELQQT